MLGCENLQGGKERTTNEVVVYLEYVLLLGWDLGRNSINKFCRIDCLFKQEGQQFSAIVNECVLESEMCIPF
jgi:hypothetical protein